jgi:drug/metabolite transporter (DMT)-like permease
MTPYVTGIVVVSALMHATWNALLRSSQNRLQSLVIMNMTSATISLPVALLLPSADQKSWPYLVISLVLQLGYCFLLDRAYQGGDLGQIYPIMRGMAPCLVTAGAAIAVGETPTRAALLGIFLVSIGILALAIDKNRPRLKSLLSAVAAGFCIATFTIVDGLGARRSANAIVYALWLFIFQGAAMPIAYSLTRGRLRLHIRDADTIKAIAGGSLALLAYGSIIVALTLSSMGPVAALRELSIVFAAIIAVTVLREALTWRRIGSAIIITLGAVILAKPY